MSELITDSQPQSHTYPQQEYGDITHDQLAADIAAHPGAYSTVPDNDMIPNGIPVELRDDVPATATSELPAFEQSAVAAAVQGREQGSASRRPAGEYHHALQESLRPVHLKKHLKETGFMEGKGYTDEDRDRVAGALELGNEALVLSTEDNKVSAEVLDEPRDGVGNELAVLPEKLKARIETAVSVSEFERSAELEKAIESYYVDHNRLAAVIDAIADNSVSDKDAERIMSGEFDGPSYALNQTVKRLVSENQTPENREKVLRDASTVVATMLFNEHCVGALTLEPEDQAVITGLYTKIRDAAVRDDVAFIAGSQTDKNYYWKTERNRLDFTKMESNERFAADIAERSGYLARNIWQDSRFAGQLLFHNTANMDKIAQNGYRLMSRSAQAAETGSFNAHTAVFNGSQHTNVVHWAENFDRYGYRGDGSMRPDGTRFQPGTLAIPLAEMIRIAPYARQGLYGQLQPKADCDISRVTINDGLGTIGPGSADIPGQYGMDRVFFADYKATNVQAAHDYIVDAGSGMSTESGNNSYQLYLNTEQEREEERYGSIYTYGIGQNIPSLKVLHISTAYPSFAERARIRSQQTMDELREQERVEEQMLGGQISELQRESRERPEYAGKVIMPLRQGVIEFYNESAANHNPDAFLKYGQVANPANTLSDTTLRAARVAKGIEQSDEQIAAREAQRIKAEAAVREAEKQKAIEMAERGETEEQYQARKLDELKQLEKELFGV